MNTFVNMADLRLYLGDKADEPVYYFVEVRIR
jgi:hypothetical protein